MMYESKIKQRLPDVKQSINNLKNYVYVNEFNHIILPCKNLKELVRTYKIEKKKRKFILVTFSMRPPYQRTRPHVTPHQA